MQIHNHHTITQAQTLKRYLSSQNPHKEKNTVFNRRPITSLSPLGSLQLDSDSVRGRRRLPTSRLHERTPHPHQPNFAPHQYQQSRTKAVKIGDRQAKPQQHFQNGEDSGKRGNQAKKPHQDAPVRTQHKAVADGSQAPPAPHSTSPQSRSSAGR